MAVTPDATPQSAGENATPDARAMNKAGEMVAEPRSTAEEDRSTAGQRHINLMWESTQRQIAVFVVIVAMVVSGYLAIMGTDDTQMAAFVFLSSVATTVIVSYFTRTNHTRTGGVTPKGDR